MEVTRCDHRLFIASIKSTEKSEGGGSCRRGGGGAACPIMVGSRCKREKSGTTSWSLEPILTASYRAPKRPRWGTASVRPRQERLTALKRSLGHFDSLPSVTMSVTPRSDDLTIPELFHVLKQRLYGVSENWIRYVALIDPWRTCVRVALTCTASSSSSGLDLREVRGTGGENR